MSRLHLAAALFVASLLPAAVANSAIDTSPVRAQPRAWSAMAGTDTAGVIAMAERFGAGAAAEADAPWCDKAATVAETLSHDFAEALVDDSRVGGANTQLWASPVMGTWTLVLARADGASCIVASGIGYKDGVNPDSIYAEIGLLG